MFVINPRHISFCIFKKHSSGKKFTDFARLPKGSMAENKKFKNFEKDSMDIYV